MRIFRNKWFTKFARDEDIRDAQLMEVVNDASAGLVDANYGGGLIKQRIARRNQGSSGGYRAIVLFRQGDKAFFVFGFAKNERSNISKPEEKAFKDLASVTLKLTDEQITKLLLAGTYEEINQEAPDNE